MGRWRGLRGAGLLLGGLLLALLGACRTDTGERQTADTGALVQPPVAVVRLGILADSVRDYLATQWDSAYADPAQAREMGYCLKVYVDPRDPSLWFVMGVRHGQVYHASPSSVLWRCAPDEVPLHTHPPVSCTTLDGVRRPCRLGGWWANQCAPSAIDMAYRPRHPHEFKGLQCDRRAVLFYRPLRVRDTARTEEGP